MTQPPIDPRLATEDVAVLATAARGNAWLRAVLCTLARRGAALRQSEPERAVAITEAINTWPFYKAGQFVFDLMEWEDFMVDGPAPDVVSTVLDSRALGRLTETLSALKAHLDGDPAGAGGSRSSASDPVVMLLDEDLPPLEAGFHLYRDVVLGAVLSLGPQLRAAPLPTDGSDHAR